MNINENEIQLDMRDMLPFIRERLDNGETVMISGGGKSMYPFIDDENDKVVLRKRGDRPIKVGEIYLYRRANGRYSIHRVYSIEEGSVTMLGDGQVTLERGIPNGDIIAVVTEVIKPDGAVDCLGDKNVRSYASKMRRRMLLHRVRAGILRRLRSVFKFLS